jgi:peptidoglycan hydrolase CwlO-like protein
MKKSSDYQKIMQVIEAKGINQTEAEKLTDLGVGTIGKLLKRKAGFGSLHKDNLKKFLRTFNVNQAWWDKAEGPMFLEGQGSESEQMPTAADFRRYISNLEKNLDDLRKHRDDQQKIIHGKEEEIETMEEHIKEQEKKLERLQLDLDRCEKKLIKINQDQ